MSDEYVIGIGIADVTGEAGGVGMMGMGQPMQRTAGILNRQWARAFVIGENQPDGNRLVFVNVDIGMIFTAVHQEVLRRLAETFGERYTADNVMLAATHTHSGPGGFGYHTLYNLTIGGFRPATFEAIVSGIVLAVERADENVSPGSIGFSVGELHQASVNRSLTAFMRNPGEDRERFPGAIDPRTVVLRLEQDGRPVGVLNWFATHTTSMPNTNRLINGDNKGYAAYLWEHHWQGQSSEAKSAGEIDFLAGFAQSSCGDVSPNIGAGSAYGPADNPFVNTKVIGTRQAERAHELFTGPRVPVTGPIGSRKRFIDFFHIEVDDQWTGGRRLRTWPTILGQAFMAGTWDGAGASFLRIGAVPRHPLLRLLDRVTAVPSTELVEAHAPKVPGVATGICRPVPWTPQVLAIQVARIGQLAIVAAPGEFSITSGYRVRAAVAAELAIPVDNVIFAGYANSYAGYVTTPEEYEQQNYEGGSTHFGPATLPAYQQEFARLAADLTVELAVGRAANTSAPAAAKPWDRPEGPPELRKYAWTATLVQRPLDRPGRNREFGDVLSQPPAECRAGDPVRAEFVGACPSNDTRHGSTFLQVEQLRDDGTWRTVATDDDWNTLFQWTRTGFGTSRATICWSTTPSTPPGTYRITYLGDALVERGAAPVPISGRTDPFAIC